jgi:hypothetical protein
MPAKLALAWGVIVSLFATECVLYAHAMGWL